MTKQELGHKAFLAWTKEKEEIKNFRKNLKIALKEFHEENPELKGEEFLEAFSASGSRYAEGWNDDMAFDYAYSL